jgi:lysine decarboxylase
MDQSEAPLLDALADYHARDRYGFTPPGHRQGRGADPRTRAVIGEDAFRSDLLATAGLDDRSSSHGYLARAEERMADAVGAEQAFFSTCGSSLSVKAAMLAVAGGQGDLLLSPTPYGTCADIASIAGICHARGQPLIVDEAWGAHLPFHPDLPTWAMDAGADVCVVSVHKMGTGFEQGSVFHQQGGLVDPLLGRAPALAEQLRQAIEELPGLHVLRDEFVHGLGISGYQAADWLREHQRLDMGLSDHRRVEATLSFADDEQTAARLIAALTALGERAGELPRARPVDLPEPGQPELEPAMLPRDAFFAVKETVPAGQAVGRVCAEQITPYPPGIAVIVPGERITAELLGYLRSGLDAGLQLPDPADPSLDTIRVVAARSSR